MSLLTIQEALNEINGSTGLTQQEAANELAVAVAAVASSGALTLTNTTTDNTISVDQNGNVGTDVATDGAVHIENTGNTGIGLGVYTNIGATADAPLVSIKADEAAFDQNVVHITNDGTSNSLYIEQNGTLAASKRALELRLNSVMDDGTKSGLYIYSNAAHTSATSSLLSIINDSATATNRALAIQQDGPNIAFFLDMNGAERAVLIDHDDTSAQPTFRIDRDGNNAAAVTALDIQVDNAGAGGVIGIDFSTMSAGEWTMRFIADATDPTSGGGAATGRIAINIGGSTAYIPYY